MVADQILHYVQPMEFQARVHRVYALRRQLHRCDQRIAQGVGELQQGSKSRCADIGEATTGKSKSQINLEQSRLEYRYNRFKFEYTTCPFRNNL